MSESPQHRDAASPPTPDDLFEDVDGVMVPQGPALDAALERFIDAGPVHPSQRR